MTTFCETLIQKLKKSRGKAKKDMVKVLEKVKEDDIKTKEFFQKTQLYLEEKKAKALASRRSTLSRKSRKRCAAIPTKGSSKNKRIKKVE